MDELEQKLQAAHRDAKDRARQGREQAAAYGEQQNRLHQLERALTEARQTIEGQSTEAETSSVQGKQDREVLVECLRQMAGQLAATRAHADGVQAQLQGMQQEAERQQLAARSEVQKAESAERTLRQRGMLKRQEGDEAPRSREALAL